MTYHSPIRPVLAMAHNDLRLLVRDRGAMFFTFIFPALLAIFFGMVFGGDGPRGKMPVVVIDQDQSEVSRAFSHE